MTLLATVTGSLLLLAPCAAASTVRFTAGLAADTVGFLVLALLAVLSTLAVGFLLLALLAVLSTLAVLAGGFANLTLGHY